MFTLILMSVLISVFAEFSLLPLNNEVVIGESAYFDCTTTTLNNDVNWHHYSVGAKDHEDICLYCVGKAHWFYEPRIRVNRTYSFGIGTFRLIINSVQWQDAGRYICQEDGGIGESLSAQLVVLESDPVCNSNINPNGIVGPNSCNIEPDKLQMSCSVSYYGNVPPVIQWREVGSFHPTKRNVSYKDTGYQLTCNLTSNANADLHGSSYICETMISTTNRRRCSVGVINIIHVNFDNSSTEVAYGVNKTVNCLANSSQRCSYRWKWVDGVHEEVVSHDAALILSKLGWHKCEATCSIRRHHCTVVSGLVHVVEQTLGLNAEFSLFPLINEAVIGETIYFECTSTKFNNDVHWLHYVVGAKDHEDICLHCLGKTHPHYKHRIRVKRTYNSDKSTFRLIINPVQKKDAGRYICQEDGGIGESLTAQLVVLESDPVCNSNINPNGVVGPNSCNIEPEKLQMSCSVSYYGNVPPIIQWRKAGSFHPTSRHVSCRDAGDQLTCDLTINANADLHGSSYVCEIMTSTTNPRSCFTGVISIIHVNIDTSSTEMVYGANKIFNCLANSSQPCSYRWKWVDGVHEEVVSHDAALTPSKKGWHKCEATCRIRHHHCTVVSGLVHVVEQTPPDEAERKIILITFLVFTISILIFFISSVIFIVKLRSHTGTPVSTCKYPKRQLKTSVALQTDHHNYFGELYKP